MVQVVGGARSTGGLRTQATRALALAAAALVVLLLLYSQCTTRVLPSEWGVQQRQFGAHQGIDDHPYGPGLYFMGPGETMHTFSREIHALEASYDRDESLRKAKDGRVREAVNRYFDARQRILGSETDRVVDALNIQTSDGYAVLADLSLLYSIEDPVRVARDFGWGNLYVDAFVLNTFRNGVLTSLGKMNAESFYDEKMRIQAVADAEALLRERFRERGFEVHRLLLRNYRYAAAYEKSLHDKKVAVQLAVKNEKELLVNEEKAKLQQIEAQGNARITIAGSEVNAQIARIQAEAQLYGAQVHAKADREIKVAEAEAKRLKAEALAEAGSRYVVALETAKMLDSIQGAVMTPEQYLAFVRNAWSLIGLAPGPVTPAAPAAGGAR